MKNKNAIFGLAISLIVTSLLFIVNPANAGSLDGVIAGSLTNWELAYEIDENGNAVSGDINNLINAVKQGNDIKFVMISTTGTTSAIIANVVGVTPTNIVYVKHITQPAGVDTDGNPFLYEDRQQVQLFKSNGKRELIQYNMAGNILTHTDTILNQKMKWYINR